MEPSPTPALQAVWANEQILGVMLALHGAVHAVGFLLAFELAEPKGFDYDDLWPEAATQPGRVVGVLWLLVAIALAVAGARLAARRAPSIPEIAVPLVGSVVLCIMSSPHALPGAAVSAAVLVTMGVVRFRRRTFVTGEREAELG